MCMSLQILTALVLISTGSMETTAEKHTDSKTKPCNLMNVQWYSLSDNYLELTWEVSGAEPELFQFTFIPSDSNIAKTIIVKQKGDVRKLFISGLRNNITYLLTCEVFINESMVDKEKLQVKMARIPSIEYVWIVPLDKEFWLIEWSYLFSNPQSFQIEIWDSTTVVKPQLLTGKSTLEKMPTNNRQAQEEASGINFNYLSQLIEVAGEKRWRVIKGNPLKRGKSLRMAVSSECNSSEWTGTIQFPALTQGREAQWKVIDKVTNEIHTDWDNVAIMETVDKVEFLMDRCEVSNGRYKQFCEDSPYPYPKDPQFFGRDNSFETAPDFPVVNVSWIDAESFCQWESQRTIKKLVTYGGKRDEWTVLVRLPDIAEWEYVAGVPERSFNWGSNFSIGKDRFKSNYRTSGRIGDGYLQTAPVESFFNFPSKHGLLNLKGNVWEWCIDQAGIAAMDNFNWIGRRHFRAVKGGSWNDKPETQNNVHTSFLPAEQAFSTVGFRILFRVSPP